MRIDEIAVVNAYNEIYRHGYGTVLIEVSTQTNGSKHIDISPAPCTRLELKPGEEMKPKKRLDKTP